jgi:hypothetical protein
MARAQSIALRGLLARLPEPDDPLQRILELFSLGLG